MTRNLIVQVQIAKLMRVDAENTYTLFALFKYMHTRDL